MPIYTGTGDKGFTGLFDNQRVPKDDLRIQAYGTVDEVNSFLGVLRCEPLPADLDKRLEQIQSTLFELGSNLATPGRAPRDSRADGHSPIAMCLQHTALPHVRDSQTPARARTAGRRAGKGGWGGFDLKRRVRSPFDHKRRKRGDTKGDVGTRDTHETGDEQH